MRVLVGHPAAATRGAIAALLAPHGWTVAEAADGREAQLLCESADPDVALLAHSLTADDGRPLLAWIKSHATAFRTAVVLIASDLAPESIAGALAGGADDVLLEPLRPAEVLARAESALRTRRLQEELLGQVGRIETLIFSDPLTGLQNRRYLFNQLEALVSGARRHGRRLSVVMVDIDRFKLLNDTYGHAVGDRVLVGVARSLRGRLRTEDTLARLGGEEFLAVLPDTSDDDAAMVAESLHQCASAVVVHTRGRPVGVTVSVGWATWRGEDPDALVRRADVAMYAAKAAGRDAVRAG